MTKQVIAVGILNSALAYMMIDFWFPKLWGSIGGSVLYVLLFVNCCFMC